MSQKSKASPKPSPKNTLFNYFAKNQSKTPQNDQNSEVKVKSEEKPKPLTGKQLDFGKELINHCCVC